MKRILAALGLCALAPGANAAIALVGCSSEVEGNSVSSIELSAPTHSNGDLLVAFVGYNAATITERINESGWTVRAQGEGLLDSPDRTFLVATKVASSESGTYTADTSEGSSLNLTGRICAFSGIHSGVIDQTSVNGTETTNTGTFDPAAITTQTANAWVITFVVVTGGSQVDFTDPSGYTNLFANATGNPQIDAAYKLVVSAGSENPGVYDVQGSSNKETIGPTMALKAATATAPTFSAGPTVGTITSSTLPFTFTLDQTGTVYGVACPDGQTVPTVAQVKAGNCTGNVAAQAAFTEAVVAAVSDSATLTGLAASTTYDTHFIGNSTVGGDSAAITTVANQATTSGAGVLSGAPTVTAQDTNDYTISGTTTAAVTIHAVACKKDSTAPTIAQVQAGNCTGGVAALAAVNESWNGSNNFVLGGSLIRPIHDLYVTDGTTRYNLLDELLDVPSGKQRIDAGLASVHATSPYFGQGVVAGDIPTCDTITDPSAYVITDDTDGTISYDALGDDSRQLIECTIYDVSAAVNVDFLFVFNNHAPEAIDGLFTDQDLFQIGTNPSVNLAAVADDPESDDVDFSVVSGALPDDWSLNSETGLITDGVPGACGTYDFTIRLTDIYAATTDIPSTIVIGDVIPNPAGMTYAEFQAALAADFCVP